MCRLFGTLSTHPVSASYYLENAPQSLLVQSTADAKRKQGDGWGIGWFEENEPMVFKSPRAIYRDAEALKKAAQKTHGTALVGHIRWASNPLKLPKREL